MATSLSFGRRSDMDGDSDTAAAGGGASADGGGGGAAAAAASNPAAAGGFFGVGGAERRPSSAEDQSFEREAGERLLCRLAGCPGCSTSGGSNTVSNTGSNNAGPGENALCSSESHHIDYLIQAAELENPLISQFISHLGYWGDMDVALFILTMCGYQRVPVGSVSGSGAVPGVPPGSSSPAGQSAGGGGGGGGGFYPAGSVLGQMADEAADGGAGLAAAAGVF